MVEKCTICGSDMGGTFGAAASNENPNLCVDCFRDKNEQDAFAAARISTAEKKLYAAKKEGIPISTGYTIAGETIAYEVDIITSEYVLGMNVFRDLLMGVRDIVGGRSETTQKQLRKARKGCLEELRREAQEIGANAIIGIDLDYSEFSGGGKSMLFLVASGTAVVLQPK